MSKKEFIQRMSEQCKLIRAEYGFSQDKMAAILGLSKKSLVETEKGRRQLSWNEAVCLASIFSQSSVLQNEFGGEVSDMIKALAFENTEVRYPQTMGGKIWWIQIKQQDGYRLQQNILSKHYRLLDPHDGRMISSFDLQTIKTYLKQTNLPITIDENEKE